ncbi:hypothetical protein DSM106972_003750 [Dulcicalothrix desertica PCC 7102]|uniref:Uncharacterized protein n=1 Tax=Dulcicalothrix desertica PCC 7102 TaxID=232991 RepID=A0A3S1AVE1_9CYAN|nr:hypothetical protein [Dulcicalothrix desertica]RUT09880.1 hypothetical protein DSM106972_003750 [Dulcicalothrix desertica PCC 7102]TWH51064.1 hypothetical protein CAL7102_05429 [Dulcicalothrix desertica PCC 7102]
MPSKRRKCRRPDVSPATIVAPSEVTAQQLILLSPVKLAISFLDCKSQTFSVVSEEAEINYFPQEEITKAFTESL